MNNTRLNDSAKWSVVAILVVSCWRPASAFASDIYVYAEGKLTTVHNGDASKYQPSEWQAWYFQKGLPAPGTPNPTTGRWGGDSAKTAQALMEKVTKSQNFELAFNEWAGKGRVPDDRDTTFNVVAPVAVMDKSRAPKATGSNPGFGLGSEAAFPSVRLSVGETDSVVAKASETLSQMSQALQTLGGTPGDVRQALNPEAFASPYTNVGRIFGQYAETLKEIFKLNRKLASTLNGGNSAVLTDLNSNITHINELNDGFATEVAGWQQGLGNVSAQRAVPNSNAVKSAQAQSLLQTSLGTPYNIDHRFWDAAKPGTLQKYDFSKPGLMTGYLGAAKNCEVELKDIDPKTIQPDTVEDNDDTHAIAFNTLPNTTRKYDEEWNYRSNTIVLPMGMGRQKVQDLASAFKEFVIANQQPGKPAVTAQAPTIDSQKLSLLQDQVAKLSQLIALLPKVSPLRSGPGQQQAASPAGNINVAKVPQDDGSASFAAGTQLYDQGNYAEAEPKLRLSVRLQPNNVAYHNQLGLSLFSQAKYAEAEAEFRAASQLSPNDVGLLINIGDALNGQKKRNEAEAQYRAAAQLNPRDGFANDRLGGYFYALHDYVKAESEYNEAVRREPNNAKYHYNLGGVLSLNNKLPGAEFELREAVRLKPDDSQSHMFLGLVLEKRDKVSEAEAEYYQATRVQPDNWGAHRALADFLYNREKRYTEAETEYRELIRIRPNDPNSHSELAQFLNFQKRYQEAEDEYHTAIRLKPDDSLSHYVFALYLENQARYDAALVEYNESLRLDPDSAYTRKKLAIFCLHAKFWKEAEVAIREILRLEPNATNWQTRLDEAVKAQQPK